MALIPPSFLDTVVTLGTISRGETTWTGTGFLYGRLDRENMRVDGERKYHLFLITNKHVLTGLEMLMVKFNSLTRDCAMNFEIDLVDEHNRFLWTGHPDPEVDVAAIKINPAMLVGEKMRFSFFKSDEDILLRKDMIAVGASEGDRTFALGFPMGIVSPDHHYVIARQGCIARIRDFLDLRTKDFLIDTFIFPGNSGGPVFSIPDCPGASQPSPLRRPHLIGIVKGYLPYKDVAVSQNSGKPRIIFEENTGLSMVLPVDYIMDAVEIHHREFTPANDFPIAG